MCFSLLNLCISRSPIKFHTHQGHAYFHDLLQYGLRFWFLSPSSDPLFLSICFIQFTFQTLHCAALLWSYLVNTTFIIPVHSKSNENKHRQVLRQFISSKDAWEKYANMIFSYYSLFFFSEVTISFADFYLLMMLGLNSSFALTLIVMIFLIMVQFCTLLDILISQINYFFSTRHLKPYSCCCIKAC